MSREVKCTVCGKSFLADAAAASPVCANCQAKAISERSIPAPQPAATAIQSGPPRAGAAQQSVTATPPRPRSRLGPVGSAGSRRFWIGYAVALAVTIGGIVSVILIGFRNMSRLLFEINMGWVCLLNSLCVVLAILLIFPIARYKHRDVELAPEGERNYKTWGFVLMLLLLTPFALAIVFFAVCGAALSVMAPAR